jgi:hypothetical protein
VTGSDVLVVNLNYFGGGDGGVSCDRDDVKQCCSVC